MLDLIQKNQCQMMLHVPHVILILITSDMSYNLNLFYLKEKSTIYLENWMILDEYKFELEIWLSKTVLQIITYSKCNRAIEAWIIFILVHDSGYLGQYRFLLIIHIIANQDIKIHICRKMDDVLAILRGGHTFPWKLAASKEMINLDEMGSRSGI